MENNDNAPDSRAYHLLDIEVTDTPAHDNPAFGSVSIRLKATKNNTNVLRMSLSDATELAYYLHKYLESK